MTDHAERRWQVYDKGQLILELSSRPGPLLSTAGPPPGLKPVTHPFLSGRATSAMHEHQLKELLDASPDLASYLDALRKAGFEVRPAP